MGFSPAAHSLTVIPTCYSSRLSVSYTLIFVLLKIYHAHPALSMLFYPYSPNQPICRHFAHTLW